MATWHEITRDPEYQELSEQGKALVKQGFFEREISSDPEFQTFSPQTQKAVFDDFWQTPDDTGEGALRSAASSFARGALRPLSDVPIAVGALTGSEGIERFGKNIQGGIESSFPVNPIQEGFFTTEIPGVAGQITSMLAGGGAGAVGVKALGGTAKAAQLGAKTAVGTQAFAGGTAGGAASADVLGLKGGERIARSLLGGVTELASEAIPFGMGAETGLVRNLLGESVESGAGKILTSGATEAAEEGFAETAGQATDIAFRPEQASMDLSQIGKAMLLGGAGGGLIGAINNIGRPTPPESQTPIQQALAAEINAIPTNAVPPQTEDEKRAGAEAGNPIIVDPQGNTAAVAPEMWNEAIKRQITPPVEAQVATQPSDVEARLANLMRNPGLTAAVNTADSIVTTAENTSSDVSQATTAARNIIQGVVNTPQPQVAPAIELPAVTTSPAMEQPENLSQTITDSNGEIAPEMSVLPPTVQAGAGVGEAIQPQPIETTPDAIIQREIPENRVEERLQIDEGGPSAAPSSGNRFIEGGQIQEEVAPPITPQGTPTPATEGTVMPGGSAMERDATKGITFRYEMRARPPSIGTHPENGFVSHEEGGTRHGFLTYDRPLTEQEIYDYELKPVATDSTKPTSVSSAKPTESGGKAESIGSEQNQRDKGLTSSDKPDNSADRPVAPKKGDLVTVALGGREYPKTRIINVVNTLEGVRYQVDVFGSKFVPESSIVAIEKPVVKDATKIAATPQIVRQLGDIAVKNKQPLDQGYIDSIGGNIPQGYVKQGDLYVFQPTNEAPPIQDTLSGSISAAESTTAATKDSGKATKQTTTVAAPTETAAPSAKEAAVASVVQQPVEGSIPTVEQESATTAIESTEKTDVAKEAMRFLEADLTDTQRAKWTPEMFTAAQAFFDSGGKDFDSLKKAIKFPRVVQQAYLKAEKEAAAEQTRREAADAAMAREVEKATKEQAKLEADQKQREELGLKTLNSLIEKTRTNVVQGTVKSSDANQAVAILNKSGAIPNVLFTWIGTSKDFLADPANRARYPETWKAVSSNPNIEGMSENGQPIVFTDNVGVSDLDRNLAKLQGTTPEVAAVRRVILHENIHKGMFFLSLKDKMKLFQFLHRLYSPEELDQLAKSYDEYSDWRINQVSYFSIIEEAMTRDFDSMAEITRDGIWAEFMQFLRDIWQKITGKTSEPTLKNYKDVFRLIRNSLKNSEKANADRLKNGGDVRMSLSEFISNVTPEQDAAYAKAVADGDMETAQRMVDAAAKAAGYNVGPMWHGSAEQFNEFDKSRWGESDEGYLGAGFYFTNKPEVAQWYTKGSQNASIYRVFLKQKRPANIGMVNGKRADIAQYAQDLTGQTFDRYDRSPEMSVKITQALQRFGIDGIDYTFKDGSKELTVFEPSQIKSADPVTRDESGNVIPLSRRFQTASNDIRFSKVIYDSPNEAAFNSGAEVARNSDYDERDKAVRSTIREAYDLAPKDNGPSVPLDQLFDIAKQSMPDLTENEFSQILQDLYEDSGALLQAGESPFIVTTPDGQRAGSAIIVSSLPTGVMASAIDPEDDATKKFVKDIQSIESGTLKAAFEGRQFKDFMPIDRTIKPNKSYEQAAIDYVNSFLAEGGTLEQMANSVIAPNFLAGIGIEDDVMARQALVAEVRNRIVNAGRKKKSKVEKKFFERLNQRISAFWQGVGSKGGRNQGQRAYIIGNPRYSWMFLTDEVDKELKKRRDNILNVQFGNDNATSFTQNSYENADMASTVSADEVAKDTINDTEWDLIKEGEQVFDGARKTIWERVKFLVARIALYARAEAAEIKSASKASFTDAQRDELAAILTMPKAEREKAKAKDLAELDSLMAKLLGEESPTDTPTEKKKRNKRKEIIDTVEKRVKAGEPIEAPDYVPIITENPQRDEIIDDVANSLLQVAKNRGIKPSQKTALADLVASIKSLLKANIKGEDLKADEAPLGQLLARTYLDNLTATEAKLFAQSWNRGRDKVRKMLAETGLEGAALEAELSAIMPATPTIAYNPSAVRKAITRALREATLDANDLLANPQETKAEILKVWDKAAVDVGLSPENWQEGRKLAEKSIDEFIIERKAAKERSKQIAIAVVEQSKNPASLADFSNSLAQFKIKPDKVRELFDQAKLLAKRRVQIANDKAIRVLFEAENKLAQSAFFNSSTKPDTIVKAFREQISDPMDRKAFKDRLMAMEVTSEMADRLFDKAARTKDNAQWKRAQDMLEGPNALRNILREINRARPGDQAPLSKQIPWRKLLSQKAKTVEEYRQRIFDAISANEELKSATPEQKARLADLFTEAWESNRKRILDGMQERLIREKEAKGDLSKKGAEALQEQRMRMVEDINLGIFDNDEIAKIMAEKFGIKSEFTDAEREKIESLIEILQDEKLNRVKRNKAAYELLETLSAQTDISIIKLLANFWVSSVLSGMNTVFSIGMSVFSGMGELTTTLYRIFVSAFSNPKQLPSEVAAAFKTLARVLSATPRQANRAWQYLVTGDQAFLDPTMNDALKNMDYDSIGKNNQLAEQMAKSDKILQKVMGLFMRTVSRLLNALDLFNSGLTKEGSLSIVFRQLNLDPAKIEMLEKKSDLKAYKAQVIRDDFNGIAPKTLYEKALVDSYALAEMMKALDELGNVSENADQMAMQGAMTLDPSGIGGYGYRFVKLMMKSAESGADKLVERNLRKWDEAKNTGETTEAGVKLALSYIFQFAAYNAANLVGVRFARFAGNKFNQSLSFLPGLGALRLFEAEFDADRIRGKEAFTDMIKRNQLTGVMAAAIGYVVLKAIAEEPDDEKRGAFINGGWSNLTPEKKQQKLASGQKEYTLGFGDTVINYGNWPGSGIIAAIGGLSDLIRFSPEQWSEKTVSDKLMSATASGVFSALEVPALSQFQELFGSSLSSKDPNEQKLTKFARVIGNYAGGFVPRFLKDIDYSQDPNLRKYETLWEKIASHIPVYRRYEGKEYYDILGQQIQRNVYPGSREFMTKPTDPAYKVLGALISRGIWLTPANAEHRMVGKGARRRSLTQEEADNYSLETGKGYKQMLMRYGQRALQMPTERAKAFLLDKADDVRDRALKKVYRGYKPAS